MLGGQCVLAVDVPGPAPPEEQQGSVLSAALETKTSNPAQHRTDKGTVSSLYYVCVLLSVCVVECVCCLVCGASDDKHNFSDTSYESCTVAPDSSSNLRLPATPHYTCVHHVLR